MTAPEPTAVNLPCPVCRGATAHHVACSVPVLGPPRFCKCTAAEVDGGVCVLCHLPFQVGGSV